jgi:hypothetical protein
MKKTSIDINFSRKAWDELGYIIGKIDHPKKHISIILEKNKIISVGANIHHTKPIATRYGYAFGEYHSELDAIIKVKNRSSYGKLTLVNFRFNRLGEIRLARPCIKCMRWCRSYFDRIAYSHQDAMIYELDMNRYDIEDHAKQIIPESFLMPIDNKFRSDIVSLFNREALKNERSYQIETIQGIKKYL